MTTDLKNITSINDWLTLFKIFTAIGVVIFTIGQFSGVTDTDLAAYIWFGFALLATWVVTLRLLSKSNKTEVGILSALHNISQMLPALGVLVPISILVYVLLKTRPIIQTNASNLPQPFFLFNRLSFFLVVFQMLLLNKYYDVASNTKDNTSIWIAAMVLFSIITSASAIELYVIITSFLTDG